MQTGNFTKGERYGIWERYHADGSLFDSGEYIGEKKTGEWKTWDRNGNLIKTKTYLEGSIGGPVSISRSNHTRVPQN